MSRQGSEGTPQVEDLRREEMLMPDEVAAMVGLRGLGWGAKRIAAEFGCSRNTVKRYLGLGGWTRCRRPERAKALDGLADWLAERFRQHRGNADVVRQELLAEHGISGEPAHGRARGGAAAPGARGRGAGDGAVRDAARPADAGRLRREAG